MGHGEETYCKVYIFWRRVKTSCRISERLSGDNCPQLLGHREDKMSNAESEGGDETRETKHALMEQEQTTRDLAYQSQMLAIG